MVVAVVCPGQGAQKPGFLAPWLELGGAQSQLRWWSRVTGLDLVHLGTEADAATITDTGNTQPLLAAAAILAGSQLPLANVAIVAGHSIGEIPAAALAGVLSPEAALALARERGRAMAEACHAAPTGMTAILGGEPDEVLRSIETAGLTPANRNAPNQIVAAGPIDALAKLAANPPAKARLIPLQVAGAFHTAAMAPAQAELESLEPAITTANPERILLSNADGAAVHNGRDALKRIVAQVTRPVRWDLCLDSLRDLGVTALLELPPAGTLAQLAKRQLASVEILSVQTSADLPAARDLIARHGNHPTGEPSVDFLVTVATVKGTFHPAPGRAEGEQLAKGATLGEVRTRQESHPIHAPTTCTLLEWLAHDGDPVTSGQALVRLRHGAGLVLDRELASQPSTPGAQLLGLGMYQPSRIVTNEELARQLQTTDEWIQDRIGIRERRLAAPEETVADMATAAAADAIAHSDLTSADIDLVIVGTSTASTPLPNVAAQVAARLGLTVGAFDLNTACSSFSYALATAHHAIRAGAARHVLVIGAERYSSWLDWSDRSTAVIFGDGAGAALVGPAASEGIGPTVWGSDGSKSDLIRIENGVFSQQGPAVFRWAVTNVAPIAAAACEAAGIDPKDLAAVVPHQANLRIIEAIAAKLGAANAVVARDVVESGNTSAASIPIAFTKLVRHGEIPPGAPVLLIGFGGGLTYAGQVVRCP